MDTADRRIAIYDFYARTFVADTRKNAFVQPVPIGYNPLGQHGGGCNPIVQSPQKASKWKTLPATTALEPASITQKRITLAWGNGS